VRYQAGLDPGGSPKRVAQALDGLPSMLRRYAVSCLAVALATGLKLLLGSILEQDSPFLLYFAAVVASALYGGIGPGIFAAVISAGAAAYLFLPPFDSFTIANSAVRLRLGVFVVETIFISGVCGALRSAKHRLEATRADLEAGNRFAPLRCDLFSPAT